MNSGSGVNRREAGQKVERDLITWTKLSRVPAVMAGVVAPTELLGLAATEQLMALRDAVRERGVGPDGRPFVCFSRFDEDDDSVYFDVGIPTSEPWTDIDPDEGRPGDMPGGFAATTRHSGTYESIPAALKALADWIIAQGRVPVGSPYQFHTDAPEDSFDRKHWETELVWFVQ